MIEALRNVPVRRWVRALERDGFLYRRAKGSQRVYRHPDGRRVVLHTITGATRCPSEP